MSPLILVLASRQTRLPQPPKTKAADPASNHYILSFDANTMIILDGEYFVKCEVVLGKDKDGRVRGMGRGITATKLAFIQARDAHVQKLEAKQAALVTEVEDLKHLVRDLAKGKSKDEDDRSQSGNTGTSKGSLRCQLLVWYSEDDVVVAAVLVNLVVDKKAYVWRPTTAITLLGDTMGTKIAWSFDKLILDSIDSPTANKTDGSSATNALEDRIQIIAWTNDAEVIAEGYMVLTDPTEMVNNIHLGPNDAKVKIDKVINKEAYMWRPNEDMKVIGDALFAYVAWPVSKILLCEGARPTKDSSSKVPSVAKGAVPSKVSSSKNSSPKSVANSSGTSVSPKKNCLLLDWFRSGQTVAEGKVLSDKPEDKVHFVPLGPNASKVWVESFLLHQIRKMIGVSVAFMRNYAPESLIQTSFNR
ncbi:hypothetical protein Bca4012_077466 [Brassica carinata]